MATQRAGSCQQQPSMQSEAQAMDGLKLLEARLPARRQQIGQLVRLLGRPQQQGTNVFVHGAPKSGKTTVVREILRLLGRKHAYFVVGETTKSKQLFSSILTQIHAVKRKREHGYAGMPCDNVVDFVNSLASACPVNTPTAFIVLDGAQLLARTPLLTAMLHAHEATGTNVAFILVSSVPMSSQWYFEGVEHVVMSKVYFPAYTEDELISILVQDAERAVAEVLRGSHGSSRLLDWGARTANGGAQQAQGSQGDALASKTALYTSLYKAFISGVVSPNFMPTTCSLCDLRAVAAHLWPAYIQPIGKEVDPNSDHESLVRKLRTCIKQRMATTLQALQPGMTHAHLIHAAVLQLRGVSTAKGGSSTDAGRASTQHAHDWGSLPTSAKLLVVAGYIASHNKASHDKAMFEVGPRRGRVRGAKAALDADRQAEVAKEARLKGPSPFTLHRLLYIYQVLYRSADHVCTVTSIGSGGNSQASFQAQGLSSLRFSFIITAASLRGLQDMDQQTGRISSIDQGMGAAASLLAPLPHRYDTLASGPSDPYSSSQEPPAVLQPLAINTLNHSQKQQSQEQTQLHASGADDGAEFTALLVEAQQKIGARKGKGARTKSKTGASTAAEPAIASQLPGYRAATTTGRSTGTVTLFESASAQLPHPASGVARHGALAIAPDAAALLHNITSLTTMGLFKRGAADDMLEAPRLSLGCVNEHLAASLARDCGLKLHSFLKYA